MLGKSKKMEFRTKIPIKVSENKISHQSNLLLLGSCFAENMGDKFKYHKFSSFTNPFGIIFNPISLEKIITRCINKNYFNEKDIFFHNDLWHCFEIHSSLSKSNKEDFLNSINEIVGLTHEQIKKMSHCIITLGTSWVYRRFYLWEIVANCHKMPQKDFEKILLETDEISKAILTIVFSIQEINPYCELIFTVSPVRHIKDGFVENTTSKSHLITSLQGMINLSNCDAEYFPAYEIMMDELRDYRFYNEDMLHPNKVAIDYIWNRFSDTYFSKETQKINLEIEVIQKGLEHKPFNSQTESHQKFIGKLQDKIDKLASHNIKF